MFDLFFLNTIRDTHQKTNRHPKKDMQGRKEGKKGKEGQGRGRKEGEGRKEGRNWHSKFLEAMVPVSFFFDPHCLFFRSVFNFFGPLTLRSPLLPLLPLHANV